MAEVIELAKAGVKRPDAGAFLMTDVARDILRSLRLVHEGDGALFTMIYGLPGCGKSMTLKQFSANEGNVDYIAFKSGEGKTGDVSEVLLRHYIPWENPNGKSIPLRREILMNKIASSQWRAKRTLLADEAQHLSADGIEWLRGLAEDAGVSIAFAGDIRLAALIEPIPQQRSRMIRPVVVKGVSEVDIKTIAASWNVSDRDILNVLFAAAKQPGAMRNVTYVLSLAFDFAGGSIISAQHVRAAIVDLKLTTRLAGGK